MQGITARETARSLYITGGPDTFDQDIEAHRVSGHIIDEPDAFFAWRTVGADWSLDDMLDPLKSDPSGECAFLWCIAGSWQKAVRMALEITPWVRFAAYQRRDRAKIIAIERVLTIPIQAPSS